MAVLSVTVPDALVTRLVAALQFRYPDLQGTAGQVGKNGVRRLLAECLAEAEAQSTQQAEVDSMIAKVNAARAQAKADAEAIS